MSFTYRYAPDDPPATLWLCQCKECGEEFEKEMEPDFDEETGRVFFLKPSFCPVCDSLELIVETN